MLILGLGHKAQQGKDTFADAVWEANVATIPIALTSFADPLRDEVRERARELWSARYPNTPIDGPSAMRLVCEDVHVAYDENSTSDLVYPFGRQRQLHQWWGTEYRRKQFGEHYWTDQARSYVKRARSLGVQAVIFRDVRFPNEYDLIGELKGWRIKISRLGFDSRTPQHASERALDHHDFDLQLAVKDGELNLLRKLSRSYFENLLHYDRAA